MKFVESGKVAEVMGNKVKIKPVPFKLAIAGMNAQTDVDRVSALAAVVRECVTMEDGTPIDPDELSVAAIGELGAAALAGKGDIASFT